ncbi:MAG: hypothetical protein GXP54_08045 [Deltaproteobacteria bacterium]|nr:hypothetical protein [Deltaproteobacteria bacterium]
MKRLTLGACLLFAFGCGSISVPGVPDDVIQSDGNQLTDVPEAISADPGHETDVASDPGITQDEGDQNDTVASDKGSAEDVAVPVTCGADADCEGGEYCKKIGCTGKGSCAEIPTMCTKVYNPVCGCDGNDYDNECLAAMAGVNISHEGVCVTLGCKSNTNCGASEYCKKTSCDGIGACSEKPTLCLISKDPVCGCDGKNYKNECFAAQAGVNVDYKGECSNQSCLSNDECQNTEYCYKDGCLGGLGEVGECTLKPVVCPLILDPVCGCNGKNYDNDCQAASAGVNVDHKGKC